MDFFAEQRIRRRRSLLLYGLFFLIVLAHMAVALAVVWLLFTVFTGGIYYWALVLVVVWILASFVGGSYLEYRRLRAGGRAIAQRVGAVRLFIDHSQDVWAHSHSIAHQHEPIPKVRFSDHHIAVRDERDFPPVYRRYYEIAQQLAIASGLPLPILYVLPDEQGINGFVAGRHSQDMVLVVTQGALDKLSDDALYGLIGHEYGHILHGDAKFNLQLMVVLAGLQILYDWSDPIGTSSRHHHNHSNRSDGAFGSVSRGTLSPYLSQGSIDHHARRTESQTASFTTHGEWVAYWQTQSQAQQSSAKRQSRWSHGGPVIDRQAPRSVWTLMLHGLSFSSMASAQLIKHSFNRQRELLADATSVQLTRSPAIIETLKAIHQDALGSRLTGIADINGLSHFFFASSGADLGDVSWFATHPSLSERMSAISANAYHDFAVQVAREKRLNQQKIKEIYEQRRLGDWGVITTNSLSSEKETVTAQSHISKAQPASAHYSADNSSNESTHEIIDNKASDFVTNKLSNKWDADAGLAFVVEEDVVIDGRLQVQLEDSDTYQLLKPWQAAPDSDLPSAVLISVDDLKKVTLSQCILNHSHHPLGVQALIEAVMLCHQWHALSTVATYDLQDIWMGMTDNGVSTNSTEARLKADTVRSQQVLAHTIDSKLLIEVARLDRRLDSALIAFALKQLRQHKLSKSTINELRLKSEHSHSSQSQQSYKQQQRCRTMLLRYQQGILELFRQHLSSDLTFGFAHNLADQKPSKVDAPSVPTAVSHAPRLTHQSSPILPLWQALQLQQLLPVLAEVLGDDCTEQPSMWQPLLKTGVDDIWVQLDPSGQVFDGLDGAHRVILTLLAYRLSKDVRGQMVLAADNRVYSSVLGYHNDSAAHYVTDLRRHARLIDIDLAIVSDANLHWLLLTAQRLNSVQLLAVINTIPAVKAETKETPFKENCRQKPPYDWQMDYNKYRQWLGTLHTVMLHDTIISQDEYDCLMMLSECWLGVRQLF